MPSPSRCVRILGRVNKLFVNLFHPQRRLYFPSSVQISLIRVARLSYRVVSSLDILMYRAVSNASLCCLDSTESSSASSLACSVETCPRDCVMTLRIHLKVGTLPAQKITLFNNNPSTLIHGTTTRLALLLGLKGYARYGLVRFARASVISLTSS
jgi:hypothetical protein